MVAPIHTNCLLAENKEEFIYRSCFSFFFLELHEEWEDKENVVEFDFLGKDSVRYWNFVPVEKKVPFLAPLHGFLFLPL